MPSPEASRRNGLKGGKPKGAKHQSTITKELAREALREQITARLAPLTDAQMDHAEGIYYMVLRNSDGTYTRATNVDQVDAALAIGETAFKLFTQAPNPQAYNTLLAYAVDRPKEQAQDLNVNLTASEALLSRLDAGRLRAKTRTPK